MQRFAINIALVPAVEVMDEAIKINQSLANDPIVLNTKDCLPHITLCMGVVEKKDFSSIRKIIDEVVVDFLPLNLTVTGLNAKHTAFDVEKTARLQLLHETLMRRLDTYLHYDGNITEFFTPPAVVEKTLTWVNKYKAKSSFENYYPHITLGTSGISEKKINIKFRASRIVLCHMGNYCTCRKMLHEVDMSQYIFE